MLDTLKLSLGDFEIAPNADLTVQAPTFNLSTNEFGARYPLWRSGSNHVVGSKAFHNSDNFNVTVQPYNPKEPQSIGCFVQFSVPKVANGSNYEPADLEATGTALVTMQSELRSIGIRTNILRATVSRLDSCKTICTQEPYEAYAPILSRLQGQRVSKRDYGTTFLWHNTLQEVCVYDKIAEMLVRKKNVSKLPKNSVRVEHRMLKARKVRDVLGFNSVADLLVGFEQVEASYKSAMKTQLFRYSPAELEIVTVKDFESYLKVFKEAGNAAYVDAFVRAVGFRQLSADKEAFLRAVENVSDSRMTLSRTKKKLVQSEIDALALQRETTSKHTLGELYRELEREVLGS